MRVKNYLVCSLIILFGIGLLLSGNIVLELSAVLWYIFNRKLSTINSKVRKMWKSYVKSTIKLEMLLGIY